MFFDFKVKTVILQNDCENMYPSVWKPNLGKYICLHMS